MAAGVNEPAFIDACTVDVAMTGNDAAAMVFVGMPRPAAVGKIVVGGGHAAAITGGYWRSIRWLLLLLIVIAVIVWLILKRR